MILKEFDLDIPYIGDSKEDYQHNWKTKRMQFRDQIRCVASMFERYFRPYKYKTPQTWKILIECYEDLSSARHVIIPSEVYVVAINFDICGYFEADNKRKKEMIFEAIERGIEILLNHELLWDRKPFDEVRKQVFKEKLINKYSWGKVNNPSRNLSAEISCEHEIDQFNISLLVHEKKQGIALHQRIITEIPNEWNFSKHFGKLYWSSNNEVVFVNKEGNEIIRRTLR